MSAISREASDLTSFRLSRRPDTGLGLGLSSRQLAWALGGVLVLSCMACSEAAKPTTEATPAERAPSRPQTHAKAAAAEPTSAAGTVPTAPTARVSEVEARAVFERWLAAQNSGDFAAYSALYAERFQGTKRVGLRSERFDRAGWLRDRERMFGKPMQVAVSAVQITSTCCMASVHFTQTFASGDFQDQGPKEVRLVPTPEGLRIAGEEMISSNIERGTRAHELDASDFRFVVHARDAYVVLGFDGRDEQGEGMPVLSGTLEGSVVATRKALKEHALSPALAALRGKAVNLYDARGLSCSGNLGEVFLLRRVVPHFGTLQHWKGSSLDDGEPHQPVPLDQVARDAWQEASEETLLVAALDAPRGECANALWARDSDRAEPQIYAPQPASDELSTRVTQHVRRLRAYQNVARAHAKQLGNKPDPDAPWEHYDGAVPRVRTWQRDQRTFVSFEAQVGGCADYAALWALFELQGDALVLRSEPGGALEPSAFSIGTVLDANGDGLIEVLGGDTAGEANTLLRSTEKGLRFVREIEPPFHDCGC